MRYAENRGLVSLLRSVLKEDIGKLDITAGLLIPKSKSARAVLLAKEECLVCGLGIAGLTFRIMDKRVKFKPLVSEGRRVEKGTALARIAGPARSILTAERVALNFLGLLCGVATMTRQYVNAVKPCKVKILDTRKTIPGLRQLEKYAVRVGGGFNHRMRLDEMVLLKDNHLQVIRQQLPVTGLKSIIGQVREKIPAKIKIEIEVGSLREFKEALKSKPDIIMLDNMKINNIKKAVKLRNSLNSFTLRPSPKLEASGGVNLKNVRQIAKTGVDMISVGALTHSVHSVDLSLEFL